jgi:hypothetical protein
LTKSRGLAGIPAGTEEVCMQLQDLLAIQPQDYLQEGFFTPDGSLREGINGYYSLAMAYRLREEGMGPDEVKALVDEWARVTAVVLPDSDEAAHQPLSPEAMAAFQRLRQRPEVTRSVTLTALLEAAAPWLRNGRDWAALALHLQRIMAQLALLRALSQGVEP